LIPTPLSTTAKSRAGWRLSKVPAWRPSGRFVVLGFQARLCTRQRPPLHAEAPQRRRRSAARAEAVETTASEGRERNGQKAVGRYVACPSRRGETRTLRAWSSLLKPGERLSDAVVRRCELSQKRCRWLRSGRSNSTPR